MNVTTQNCFILTTALFTVTKESYETIFCLINCNHPKLFYFNHHIIYYDLRELSNDFLSQ